MAGPSCARESSSEMPKTKTCPYCTAENNVYATECTSCHRSLIFEMPWSVNILTLLALGGLAYLMFYLMELLRSRL